MAIIPGEFEKNILIDTPQQQKNRKLIAVFVGVVIIIIGVIYFGFFSGSGDTPAGPTIMGIPGQMNPVTAEQIDQSDKLFESLSKVDLNNPIFKDKKFQSLILSDRLPVVIGEKGRENPFAAF